MHRLVLVTIAGLMTLGGCRRWTPPWNLAREQEAGAAPGGSSSGIAREASSAPSAARDETAPPPSAPDGYSRATVLGIVTSELGNAVLLEPESGGSVLPIFVSGTEALSIGLRFDGQRYKRPLTHDLLDSMLARMGGEMVKVQVDELRDSVFIGSVYVRQGSETTRLDARPSDAIALALGNKKPIFVARTVIEAAGIAKDEVVEHDESGAETLQLPAQQRIRSPRKQPVDL